MSKHEFILQDLLCRIYMKSFPDGKLSSQRELAKEYQVSRFTIQEVLKELNDIGIIKSTQGSGIFIQEKIKNNPLIFNSLTKTPYKRIDSKVIHFSLRKPTREEKTIFRNNGDVWEFTRIRYVNYQAEQLEKSCLPVSLFPDFNTSIAEKSIQNYVEESGYKISHNLTTYTPTTVSLQNAKLLFCKKGTPAMKIQNRSFLKTGEIYEISEIIAIHYQVSYIRPFDRQIHKERLVNK